MAENIENMTSRGVRLTPSIWDECDRQTAKLQLRSRNEFIRDAITFYLEWLGRPQSTKFLTPALESVISGKLKDSEDRLARLLFKIAVEQNMTAHIFANNFDYTTHELDVYAVTVCKKSEKRTVRFRSKRSWKRNKCRY